MRLLPLPDRHGQSRAGFAQPEAPLPEQPLALTHPQVGSHRSCSIQALNVFPSHRFTAQTHVARHSPAEPDRSPAVASRSGVGAARSVRPPSARPDPALQSGGPSTRPSAGHRPAGAPLPDRSCLGPPTTPHGAGDRSEILPNGESHLAVPEMMVRHPQSEWSHASMKPQFLIYAQLLMTLCLAAAIR